MRSAPYGNLAAKPADDSGITRLPNSGTDYYPPFENRHWMKLFDREITWGIAGYGSEFLCLGL